jgi:hypothetical protein
MKAQKKVQRFPLFDKKQAAFTFACQLERCFPKGF